MPEVPSPAEAAERPAAVRRLALAAAGVAACALLAGLTLNLNVPLINADMILMSIQSIQRPELFFWGQDRFAMLFPLLLSPIRNPEVNLLGLSFLHGFAYFLFLLVVSQFVASNQLGRRDMPARVLAFLMPVAITAIAMRGGRLADLVSGPQPYPASFLLLALAVLVFFFARLPRWAAVLGAGLLLSVAMGVNQSIILPIAAIALAALLLGRATAGVAFFLLSAALFGTWYVISRAYPRPGVSYFAVDLTDFGGHLGRALASIGQGLRLPVAIVLLATGLILYLLPVPAMGRRLKAGVAGLVAFAMGWALVFAENAWVQANAFSGRYFSTTCFGLIIAVAVVFTAHAFRLSIVALNSLSVVLAAATVAVLVRPVAPLADIPAFTNVAAQVAYAREHRIKYVAGDYWLAWPAVFRMLDTPRSAFGLAFRGAANREAVVESLRVDAAGGGTVEALCLAATPAACVADAQDITGFAWRPSDAACPGACTVLVLAAKPEPS
jgi:hypothetical protein